MLSNRKDALPMLIRDDILERLCCPVTGAKLSWADELLLQRVNAHIAAGQALTRLSDVVQAPVAAALVNEDRSLLYRIDEGIVALLATEAIEIWELQDSA